MITDQLPPCERCGRCAGRPYQVHWGTLERRPLRDDQENGGYVVIQSGYRIDGSLVVSLCDPCAYWTYNVKQTDTRHGPGGWHVPYQGRAGPLPWIAIDVQGPPEAGLIARRR